MCQAVGVKTPADLFATLPADCRFEKPIDLPAALTEWELNDHMDALAKHMADPSTYTLFLGAGRYRHHIPAAVSQLAARSEFVTAYTPYQPEISQGTLQAIYEYQTLCARLLGTDVATASHYDGASALAEALLMALRVTKQKKVALSNAIHPFYRQVVETYFKPTAYDIIKLPYLKDGSTDLKPLDNVTDLAAVAVQSPNFFGCIEDIAAVAELAHQKQALCVSAFTEALAFGLIKSPGSQGADIVCGEGQSLGIAPSFGGAGLGMLASSTKFLRQLPGRLVGKTKDIDGRRGFVLTLATREQHIRRERATSNICTNNSLCAVTAAIYMAAAGQKGMTELAQLNHDKTEYLKSKLAEKGFEIVFSRPTFNEFTVKFPAGFKKKHEQLAANNVIAGLPLDPYYPELVEHALLCVTETISKADMDNLVKELGS
jgi:glycine dehydrogenase subunit 1